MSIDFNQLNSNLSDSVREIITDKLGAVVDQICEKVEQNLNLESEIDLSELMDEICITVNCNACYERMSIDDYRFDSSGDLDIEIDGCPSCTRENIMQELAISNEFYVHSKCNIDYEIDRVEVRNNEMHIYLNDQDLLEEKLDVVYGVFVGDHLMRRFYTDIEDAKKFVQTDHCQRILRELEAMPKIVALRKEM